MVVLGILFIIILISCIIITFSFITINNFKEHIIRINEAEANIEATLNKRFDLLNKSTDIIKNSINIEGDVLKTIINIRSQKLNNFELDIKLYESIEEFHEYAEKIPELKEIDEYTKIEIDLIESEAEIIALKKYYNDIILKYNDLINKFPSSLIAKIKKYKEKNSFKIEDHFELINSLK